MTSIPMVYLELVAGAVVLFLGWLWARRTWRRRLSDGEVARLTVGRECPDCGKPVRPVPIGMQEMIKSPSKFFFLVRCEGCGMYYDVEQGRRPRRVPK